MGSWRNHGEDHHRWSRSSSSSYNKKPPLNIWKPTVPIWEKMFCASVGLIPWSKIVETKNYMYLHENVINWDDSAGREAFDNAKKRFWALMNDLPCDIPLPDPNTYIDDIDWSSNIVDPELVLDLEIDGIEPSEQVHDEKVMILGGSILLNQSFSSGEWGTPKHPELVSRDQVNQGQNKNVILGTQYYTPCYAPYRSGKYNSWRWNPREHRRSYTYGMGRGRNNGGGRGMFLPNAW